MRSSDANATAPPSRHQKRELAPRGSQATNPRCRARSQTRIVASVLRWVRTSSPHRSNAAPTSRSGSVPRGRPRLAASSARS